MPHTIAMTGATGFAGRHTVAALLARGHRVRALVRNAGTARLPREVETVQGDVASGDALRRLCQGANALVHLAGAIAATNRDDYFAINAEGTAHVVAAAALAGIARFVHVSSLAAREPHLSPYGESKAAAEAHVQSARRMSTLIVRPPAVYGPGDKATLPLFREFTRPVALIPSSAKARFSLIHAHDLARILAAAADERREGIIEVSDNRPGGYGWAELCAVSETVEGSRVRPLFLPRAVTGVVAGVIETIAGWRGVTPMVTRHKVAELYHPDWVAKGEGWPLDNVISIEKGFAETLTWYREQGWLPPGRSTDRRPHTQHETNS